MDTTVYVWSFKRGRTLNLSVECQLEVFDKMIKPILLYGSDIWGFSKNIDSLEKIQLRFCKLLLKLKSSTPKYMIYGELGRFHIEIDIKIRMVSFWPILLLGKETKLSKKKIFIPYANSELSIINYLWTHMPEREEH